MAIRLLAALIALGLLHLQPQLAHWRGDAGFRRWVHQLGDTAGGARILITVLVPVVVCALVIWLLHTLPLGALFLLIFALAVLLFSFGPHAFEADLEAIFKAPDQNSREAAAQALCDDCEHILLYRLARQLGHDSSLALDPGARTFARYLANGLDWAPAQLMVFTLALVGHWDAVIGAWKRWHQQAAPNSWYLSNPGFLGAAARADVLTDVEGGEGYTEDRTDPLHELRRLRDALLRALLAWMTVVALIVIGGWIS
jgi:AmpE protein